MESIENLIFEYESTVLTTCKLFEDHVARFSFKQERLRDVNFLKLYSKCMIFCNKL